ncbi:MAG: CBS domain-containing protein [Deltaproteobacteria bacterium]|nr:CBS domain-containing protein [Deltaproteobacteria bacterium]
MRAGGHVVIDELGDDVYFETSSDSRHFDASLVREPLRVVPTREPIILPASETATVAMRAMQREHRGCVIVTDDGTRDSKLQGIFTERDVLLRIVDRGKNPATLPIGEVMTPEPDCLAVESTVAHALNKMSVGGFRHVPVVDDQHRPAFVVSVRDVVEFLVAAFPREVLNLATGRDSAPQTREGA